MTENTKKMGGGKTEGPTHQILPAKKGDLEERDSNCVTDIMIEVRVSRKHSKKCVLTF